MPAWLRNPALYEINTWIWLSELTARNGRRIDLGSVPAAEWDRLTAFGVNAVWLMGVWERSPAARAIANQNQNLLHEFQRALPDFRPEDNVGSPYAVRRYMVDANLGGRDGLAVARKQLAERGMNLLLDFIPNHVAPDHPWTIQHPEYFIRGIEIEAERRPSDFFKSTNAVFARARDPYFPPWPDVVQLNALNPSLRTAAIETVNDIAAQCDGIRCDMAMLVLNDIFEPTWGGRAGRKPEQEYWAELIPAVKKAHPEFLFVAEAYWNKEWELQQLGFDYCYDKRLYDRLAHGTAESVLAHLQADSQFQQKLVRFLENHDEPRAAATFSPNKERAAAVTVATVPGAKLFHDGQFEGRKVRVPVFLARRPPEGIDPELRQFYSTLLRATNTSLFREGNWALCPCIGWNDNATFQNLGAWAWRERDAWSVVVVNLSDNQAQARVQLPWNNLGGKTWRLEDALSGDVYFRDGDELRSSGLYVDLPGGGVHVLIHSC
jgi:glycosidase